MDEVITTVFNRDEMLKAGFTEEDIQDIIACNPDVEVI